MPYDLVAPGLDARTDPRSCPPPSAGRPSSGRPRGRRPPLARVLRLLTSFRARHLALARKAYRDGLRRYDEGSGGAPVVLLRSILDLTRDNETLVRRSGA